MNSKRRDSESYVARAHARRAREKPTGQPVRGLMTIVFLIRTRSHLVALGARLQRAPVGIVPRPACGPRLCRRSFSRANSSREASAMLHSILSNRSKRSAKSSFAPQIDELEKRLAPAAPIVLSIDRAAHAEPQISAASALYTVTFDQPVTGVNAADFKVTTTGALTATSTVVIAGSGASYSV